VFYIDSYFFEPVTSFHPYCIYPVCLLYFVVLAYYVLSTDHYRFPMYTHIHRKEANPTLMVGDATFLIIILEL